MFVILISVISIKICHNMSNSIAEIADTNVCAIV